MNIMSKNDAYKAHFILNALEDGWTIKQTPSGAYKFTKSTKCFDGPTLEKVKHEHFTRRFIRKYEPVTETEVKKKED